jgi:hypothetical protein
MATNDPDYERRFEKATDITSASIVTENVHNRTSLEGIVT